MRNLIWRIVNYFEGLFMAIYFKTPSYEKLLKKNVDFSSPEDVTEKLKNRDVQLAMVAWIENTLRPLEINENYLYEAQGQSSDRLFKVKTKTITQLKKRMEPFIALGTPAHDLGHHLFDGLGGAAIISDDPFIAKGYRNDIDAALFDAMFHDSSTGVQHRYIDNEWELNHGELAAVIFFFNSEGLLPYGTRVLGAYAIAAHPHMLKEMATKNGQTRKPYVDELFFNEDKPVRLAVWITRWTDRLENGGDPASHLPRHALAAVDGARVNGLDLHGLDWYDFKDSLRYLFTPKAVITEVPVVDNNGLPVMKDGLPVVSKIPSMLQHLQGYAKSANTANPSAYNKYDDLSPNMRYLMDWKIDQSTRFIDLVTNTTGEPDFSLFEELMLRKSGNPISDTGLKTIQMVKDLWNMNSPEDQAHWAQGFIFANDSYTEWLSLLENKIGRASDPTIKAFFPLMRDITDKLV